MCYEVIKEMDKVKYIAPQGSCEYTKKKKRYCPDIYGTYQEESRRRKKGFVIDCKHYNPGRSIDVNDCDKLDRDRDEVEKKLKSKKRIGKGAEVRSMFVTSEGNGDTARRQGYTVISVGEPGTRGWETKLKKGFKKAMKWHISLYTPATTCMAGCLRTAFPVSSDVFS